MYCSYGLQMRFNPYMSPSDYDAVLKDHTERAFSSALHARLRAAIMKTESRGRKRMRRNVLTLEGRVDRAALLGVLANWIFSECHTRCRPLVNKTHSEGDSQML